MLEKNNFMLILTVPPSSFLLVTAVALLLFILGNYSCKVVSSDRVFTLLFVTIVLNIVLVLPVGSSCA